jgi:eukaryotic-like serine/threonine-protein kinase
MTKKLIEFLRKKDFELINELGQGACGKTVLLYDEIIRENFVCKKYAPFHEEHKELLFDNFVQEIKLLHLINHKNIVRVFNYYLYPEQKAGYILMEYIQGTDIESYIGKSPENINEIFLQAIDGFTYLEEQNILHRDIRPMNLMVANDGFLKIIDFGFGKKIFERSDFDKSISLNWWCEPPKEFSEGKYDFTTEVYFVGKLFEKIIIEKELKHFKYVGALNSMCMTNPTKRVLSFFEVKKGIENEKFSEIEFDESELSSYRLFSGELYRIVSRIEQGTKYFEDSDKVQAKLEELYKKVM